MIKKINSIAVALLCSISLFSCKQQAVIVNPGAVVSIDGTDDGLKNVKRDFEDVRINNAYGCLLLRRGNFESAQAKSQERHQPGPGCRPASGRDRAGPALADGARRRVATDRRRPGARCDPARRT